MTPAPQILIVDDNAPFRHLLAAFLDKAGFTFAEATDGQEALQIIANAKPKAILLDLQMQPMGGFLFLEKFHEQGFEIPVILITGDDSTDVLSRASKLGCVGVLKKPVTGSRVISMLQRFAT